MSIIIPIIMEQNESLVPSKSIELTQPAKSSSKLSETIAPGIALMSKTITITRSI